MISIPIGEIYAQVAKSATSYYSLIVFPLTNFTLRPLTCCVIDKGIKHTTYRKNNNLEKCAGMGLNGFHIK